MLTLHTIASGSEGNCLLIRDETTCLLVDAGISCKRITSALCQLNLTPEDLDGILITHEHTDHICGLATLIKKHRVPIYATAPTGRQLSYRIAGIEPLFREVAGGDVFRLGGVRVSVFSTSHDAACSVGYRFDGEGSIGVMTDTGYVTDAAFDALQGVEVMVLESNHDVQMVKRGPYPYHLKQRILSDEGHLSNDAAARFAYILAENGTREFILAHLSKENNLPTLALQTVAAAVKRPGVTVSVAPRCELSMPHRAGGARCRK